MYFQSILCMIFSCIGLHIIEKDVHHHRHAKRTIGRGNSQFREKLMEILKMPYNQKEYEELLLEVTDRKPKLRHKDSRGRIIVYNSGLINRSYLDYHSGMLNMDFPRYFYFFNLSFFN